MWFSVLMDGSGWEIKSGTTPWYFRSIRAVRHQSHIRQTFCWYLLFIIRKIFQVFFIIKRKEQFQRETLSETWNWPRTFKIHTPRLNFIDKSTTSLSTLCRSFSCVNNKSLVFQVQFLFLTSKSTQIFSSTVHGYCINYAQSSQKWHMGNFWNSKSEKQEHWTQYFPHGLPRNLRVQLYNFVE
jgi:hypothetical protein